MKLWLLLGMSSPETKSPVQVAWVETPIAKPWNIVSCRTQTGEDNPKMFWTLTKRINEDAGKASFSLTTPKLALSLKWLMLKNKNTMRIEVD